ncbi:MAG: hypothetical protein KA260_00165 [Burkholderiales bacterium]|nr:hypothetical protein [Burkholderiales bacterium]
MIKRMLLLLVVTVLVAGCAVWTRLDGGPLTHAGASIKPPVDWMHLAARKDSLMITRDGVAIQFIDAAYLVDDKIFPKSKQVFNKDTPPQEMAQRYIGELRQAPGLSGLDVKSVAPETVAGRPGFRAVVEWRNDRGAAFQRVIAGAAVDNGLLVLQYQSLKRFFFARDLPEFERVLQSAKRG